MRKATKRRLSWALPSGLITLVLTLSRLAGGDLIAPGAQLEKLADGFTFTEGPTADAAGNVYFTDQPNNRILKWSIDGRLTTLLDAPLAGRANGMCFDRQGRLFACADENNELWMISIAPDSQRDGSARERVEKRVLLGQYQGKRLNGPNDVWAHPNGGLYFSDPFYKRSWWKHDAMLQDGQHVYYLPKGWENATNASSPEKALVRVVDDLQQPNGIVGSRDGKSLFVADIRAGKTYRFDIQEDGRLANKSLFCELGSDGMTLDAEGNVYLTGRGVTVFDSGGKQIEHIDVPENWTANVCFGGADRKTLFITASKGLYAMRLNVVGNGPGK